MGQKGPKPVFHVPMVIERWNPIVKENSGELFAFETTISKFWSFDSSKDYVTNPKMGQKDPDWYFMYQCW